MFILHVYYSTFILGDAGNDAGVTGEESHYVNTFVCIMDTFNEISGQFTAIFVVTNAGILSENMIQPAVFSA